MNSQGQQTELDRKLHSIFQLSRNPIRPPRCPFSSFAVYGHNMKSSNDFVGRIVIGQFPTGPPEANHWLRLLGSQRTPVEQWHSLRSRAECDRVSLASLGVTWQPLSPEGEAVAWRRPQDARRHGARGLGRQELRVAFMPTYPEFISSYLPCPFENDGCLYPPLQHYKSLEENAHLEWSTG